MIFVSNRIVVVITRRTTCKIRLLFRTNLLNTTDVTAIVVLIMTIRMTAIMMLIITLTNIIVIVTMIRS